MKLFHGILVFQGSKGAKTCAYVSKVYEACKGDDKLACHASENTYVSLLLLDTKSTNKTFMKVPEFSKEMDLTETNEFLVEVKMKKKLRVVEDYKNK